MLRVLKEWFTLQLHINFTFYGANSVPGYMLWPCPCVCPTVCLSVTSWCSTKTAKHRITQTTPTILQGVHWSGAKDIGKTKLASLSNVPHTNIIKEHAKLVGQCPTWWPPCRIQVALSVQRRKVWLTPTTRCRAVYFTTRVLVNFYFRLQISISGYNFLQSQDQLLEFMQTWGFTISFATCQPGNRS